ncbi:DUF3291 domain-containing protein [Pedobacter changchengzhani]|uniref:DUF3291 domain-containing protein n=1 Tax=Pedobacter changchengzhani TaxID=2529274 RepID=A0A4R5MHG5_9SPHI|nr:DUF3291 domain-containing protein [Pedobacter changchengzhani]TDG34980.1 DUF3291 domain-containing protein [Pedobacter changchengzhani]
MIVALTITKYRTAAIPFAFMGMAILRVPLWLNKKCSFWKLMGSGKNAQVDLPPDFKHWGIITAWANVEDCDEFYKNSFAIKWFKFFAIEDFTILLNPLSAHGLWEGKQPFTLDKNSNKKDGRVAVITRAGIRLNKVKEFRENIKRAADAMRVAPGYILSAGIGELPFVMQATFSIWESAELMKSYAYKSHDHADVIKLTRERKWYSEELFARFEIIRSEGSLNGIELD